MKITIYVNHNHLETLYKFLRGENETDTIQWYQENPSRPGTSRFYMVTINYNDFLKLDNR